MAGRHRKPSSRHHRGRHRQPPPPTRWIAPTLATVAVLAAGGVSAYSALTGGGDDSGPPAAASPAAPASTTPASAEPTPMVSPSAVPTPSGTGTAAHRTTHSRPAPALRLATVGGVSWVEVSRPGGHVAFSGLLRHGHVLTYRQGPLLVTVGNAGAVKAVRHGHADGRLGRPGQVVRFTVRG
jgi:hypothetical protein